MHPAVFAYSFGSCLCVELRDTRTGNSSTLMQQGSWALGKADHCLQGAQVPSAPRLWSLSVPVGLEWTFACRSPLGFQK